MASKTFSKVVSPEYWLNGLKSPLLIAGPCSAESPQQLLEISKQLSKTGRVSYLRAGVWKPRTSPGTFEGYGVDALRWLREVKSITKMPFATEVGCGYHVYEALKYGADLIWIGARTVSNPFAVQEIADALRDVDIPVLIKNPLSTDLKLWVGAIERIYRSGIVKVGVVHRGFTWWENSIFRNQPFWKIPLLLKTQYPMLPIICDPSHISGNRKLVPLVARRAMDLGFDGLMVEVHPEPETALSDAEQQLTPEEFECMLQWIDLTNVGSKPYPVDMLNELRAEIDVMDEMLLWALSNRMELSSKIALVKKQSHSRIIQHGRWKDVIRKVTTVGVESGLDSEFVKRVFSIIHEESISIQRNRI